MAVTKSSISGCVYFDTHRCRSCSLLDLSYEEQLKRKHSQLAKLVKSELSGSPPPHALVPSTPAFGSRNKAKFAVAGSIKYPILGFPSSEGEVTEVLDCPLHVPVLNEIAKRVKDLIAIYQIEPYSIKARIGELKYILLRVSESTNQIIFRAVLRSNDSIVKIERLWHELKKQFPQIVVGSVNIQPEPKAIVEGMQEIIFSDRKFIEDRFGQYVLHFSPQTFSQVTSNIALKLYTAAGEWIAASEAKTMLDLYCGAGAFSFFASESVTKIAGVEGSPSAIDDARRTAQSRSLAHLNFECSEVGQYLSKVQSRYDLVLLNPPRRGAEKEVISYLESSLPDTIIYSSCNPATLVRDLKMLLPKYLIQEIKPFDMFPLTEHMEVLVRLVRSS